ncbi:purine-cytosine permease family protein [Jatrophihabitans fulvus]
MTAVDDRPDEVPLTLEEPTTRSLGLLDQFGMWGNLGVSLLGFTGAIYVLDPGGTGVLALSFTAGVVALVLGTVLGTAAVAVAAVPGAETGAPAMVLLRGLFGAKWSWLPSVLNVVQLTGWTTFELVTISAAMDQVVDGVPRWVWVLLSGAITTVLALRPLGWIRVLRKYVTVLVLAAMVWIAIQLLRQPVHGVDGGSWDGFWLAVDGVVSVAVSWVPVAADYSRHSTSTRATVIGTFTGYSITQIGCYLVGMIALVGVAAGDADKIFGSFLALPLGVLAFVVLAVREIDQSFVDTYSAAVSVQNLLPRHDRRVIALVVGLIATVLTLLLDIGDYYNFLVLLGSLFVPLLGVFAVDYFASGRSGRASAWDVTDRAPARPWMLLPWLLGFVTYQLINPGYVTWWVDFWSSVRPFEPQSWMSASILSFAVAAVVTVPVRRLARRGT